MAPTLSTQAGANQLQQNAYNQGQYLQNQFNQGYGTASNQQTNEYNQANQAYGNLTNYANNLPQNYYSNMNTLGGMLGYNPATTQNAAQGLTTAENIMNALPQATQQMSNYSGATAGQVAQNYGNMAQNVSGQVTNANNALQNQLGMFGQMQTGAQNITTEQSQAYQAAATQAAGLYASANQQMQALGNLAQQQGTATAGQIGQYQDAYATAQSAIAQANQVNQQVQLANQVNGMLNAIYGGSATTNAQKQEAQMLLDEMTKSNITLPGVSTTTKTGSTKNPNPPTTPPPPTTLSGFNFPTATPYPATTSQSISNIMNLNPNSLAGMY